MSSVLWGMAELAPGGYKMLLCPSFLHIMPTGLSAVWRTMLPTVKAKQQPGPSSQSSHCEIKQTSLLQNFSSLMCSVIVTEMDRKCNNGKKTLKKIKSHIFTEKEKEEKKKPKENGNNLGTTQLLLAFHGWFPPHPYHFLPSSWPALVIAVLANFPNGFYFLKSY